MDSIKLENGNTDLTNGDLFIAHETNFSDVKVERTDDSKNGKTKAKQAAQTSGQCEKVSTRKARKRKKSNRAASEGEPSSSQKNDRDGVPSVMRIVFPSSSSPEGATPTVSFTYSSSTGHRATVTNSGDLQSDPQKVPQRKRGRPRKSLTSLSAEPPKKLSKKTLRNAKFKSSKSKRKLSSSKVSASNLKPEPQDDANEVEVDAVTIATEMGFENPHEKITIKASGDKEEEITKQVSPVDIIQQVIDYKKSCSCSCLSDLSMRDIAAHRMELTLLDRQSRDFVILGLLRCAAVPFRDATRRGNGRTRSRFVYRLLNTRICHVCFLSLNNVGGKYLKNMKKHYTLHGVTSRIHGNLGRKPYHAIGLTDINGVVDFVQRYATVHGTPAARPPKNPKAKRIIRLPPSDNVTSVHKKYKEYYEQTGKRAIALTSFRKVWSRHIPYVKLGIKEPVLSPKSYGILGRPYDTNSKPENPPNVPGVQTVPSVTGHVTLKQMLKTKKDGMNGNLNPVQGSRSSDLRTAMSQKTQGINLPYDFNTGDMSHNQMMPLSMYLPEGENQDPLPYSYHLFSPSNMPMSQLPNNISSSASSATINNSSMFSNPALSSSHAHAIHRPASPMSMNPSMMHLATDHSYHQGSDKQFLLLGSKNSLDAASSQLHMPAFGQKHPIPVYAQSNNVQATMHPGHNIQQQNINSVNSSLTNLSQQIHMPLYQ